MAIRAGGNCIILKQDVKDAFRNVPVAPHQQWLLGFMWEGRYYKETYLSFGLSTAPFIFNLFGEGLHWILVSYLRWILVHYLDDFISVFSTSQAEQIKQPRHVYNWVTNLLGIPRNDSKDVERTQVIMFAIKIDTRKFTAKLPDKKLEKAVKANSKVLAEQSVTFLDIQSLVGFLSFCSQALRLETVFMQSFWDFVNEYHWAATKLNRRRIPGWVRENLEWWNDLLPAYNGVLFFDTCSRHTISIYTDASLYGLGGFFFEGKRDWPTAAIDQVNAFRAIVNRKTLPTNRRMAKNPNDPSINVHEVEVILLAFQVWSPTWHRKRVIIHTDSTTVASGLENSTLRGPANALLQQILLLAAKWDVVIKPQWVEGKRNGLADALSRFEDDKLITLVS